ncbi:MAG: DHH family phosphoesterase [Nitrosopumilus sp.]|nr:DHH family phosphoesterase [Nitrosopumilus sp.]
MGAKELKNNLIIKSQKLLKEIEQQNDILIFSNSTVDGIISGSIILKSIFNNKGNAALRCSYEKIEAALDEIIREKRDFYVFTDFDSHAIDIIDKNLNEGNYLFINIDEITKSSNNTYENIINPWLYNINGKEEISSAGLSYLFVKNFDRNSNNVLHLPIISAISKDQDLGENRSLISLNNEILQTSLKSNIIEQKKRLTISDIETMEIANVLQNNITHYIREITWNEESCLKVIKDSQLSTTSTGNAKAFNELDENESIRLFKSIEKFLQDHSKLNDIKMVKDLLFGYNYILTNEENEGFLKNTRSFAKVLDCCLNYHSPGLALSLCLGDRGKILKDAYDLVLEYNNSIKKLSSQLFREKWRFHDNRETIFINGEGVLDIQNVTSFISFLEKSVSFADRLICLRILDSEEFYRLTIIKTRFCDFDLMGIIEKIGEISNREDFRIIDKNKIEINIPVSKLEDFLSNIKKIIIDEKISQS